MQHAILFSLASSLLSDAPIVLRDAQGVRWRASPSMLEVGTGPFWDPIVVGDAFEVAKEIVGRNLAARLPEGHPARR